MLLLRAAGGKAACHVVEEALVAANALVVELAAACNVTTGRGLDDAWLGALGQVTRRLSGNEADEGENGSSNQLHRDVRQGLDYSERWWIAQLLLGVEQWDGGTSGREEEKGRESAPVERGTRPEPPSPL